MQKTRRSLFPSGVNLRKWSLVRAKTLHSLNLTYWKWILSCISIRILPRWTSPRDTSLKVRFRIARWDGRPCGDCHSIRKVGAESKKKVPIGLVIYPKFHWVAMRVPRHRHLVRYRGDLGSRHRGSLHSGRKLWVDWRGIQNRWVAHSRKVDTNVALAPIFQKKYIEAYPAVRYLKMFESDLIVVVVLEGGQLFLDAFSFYFMLKVFVLLDCLCQLVHGIEIFSLWHYDWLL
jgi:hypothetical protein